MILSSKVGLAVEVCVSLWWWKFVEAWKKHSKVTSSKVSKVVRW